MYNPYNLELVRQRQQDLIAEGDRARMAKKARGTRRRPNAVRIARPAESI